MSTFKVTYHPPALAHRHAPIQVTGEGTLTLQDDGLHVKAHKVGEYGRNGCLVAVLAIGFIVFIALLVSLGVEGESNIELAVLIGGAIATFIVMKANDKPAVMGREVEYHFPWDKVSKIVWEKDSESLIVVIKKMNPKGGLYLQQPDAELHKALTLAHHKATSS